MQYAILEKTDPQRLVDSVKAFIADGWEPCGGVALGQPQGRTQVLFYQAMMKRPEVAISLLSEAPQLSRKGKRHEPRRHSC